MRRLSRRTETHAGGLRESPEDDLEVCTEKGHLRRRKSTTWGPC